MAGALRSAFILVAAATLSTCSSEDSRAVQPPLPDPTCVGFYGNPNENTGLDTDQCFARIEGDELWTPRTWSADDIAALRTWTLDNPPTIPSEAPYETTPDLQPEPDSLCAVLVTGERTYRLETFENVAAAEAAGGVVTHGGACGLCSSLADLAAYAETPDQTNPVRQCTVDYLFGIREDLDACIQEAVGFTPACSRIWAYNALNDIDECQDVCLGNSSSYNEEDGSLNPCLQCDEDNSGPVFKAVAGRTRRNSGLAAAICRPCEMVWRVDHRYE